MPPPTITRGYDNGFELVAVDTGVASFALLPELGGKIASLRDTRSGREWLWRHPRMPYRQVAHDSSYVLAADTGGWDECFPTVAPCIYPAAPWQDQALPDHGELWSQPTELGIASHDEQLTLETVWQGRGLPYRFRRRITATTGSGRLRCDYLVTSRAEAPIRWIWCAHPLLAVEPGMRLRLPQDARYNVWIAQPQDAITPDQQLSFPFAVAAGDRSFELGVLPERSAGIALKVWSDPLPDAWATVTVPDGELGMRWGGGEWSQLALWFNLGAWAGDGGAPYYNLGLEPCIGAQDDLAGALHSGLPVATLPPGGTCTWWIEITLTL